MPRLVSPDGKPKILPPVHPNVGLEVAYYKKLDALIGQMNRSITYWLTATYRANPPRLAQDASPAVEFVKQMRTLGRRWTKQFDSAAEELGRWFALKSFQRSDNAMRHNLAQAGWTVQFTKTPVVQDTLQATIGAQVALIKSIGQQHLSDVEGLVMRSVQSGGNLGKLTSDLMERYKLTQRRAAFIAKDQNQKATATITRVRQQELGITEAIWLHSAAGREPRPKHVKYNGKKYDISKGAPIGDKPGQYVLPGELPNCRCVSRAIIPALAPK